MLSVALFMLGLSDCWDALTPRAFEQVQVGMREADVVALLGKPGPGIYPYTLCTYEVRNGEEIPVCLQRHKKIWRDGTREIDVDFDQTGVVRGVSVFPEPTNVTTRCRDWLLQLLGE
jgi:hypothetical protein